jgi:hypothetical protein
MRIIEDPLIVGLTGFMGSYSLVRGVSFFVGGFPDEYEVERLVKAGLQPWKEYPYFWYYMAAIVVLALVSSIVQWKITMHYKEKNESQK